MAKKFKANIVPSNSSPPASRPSSGRSSGSTKPLKPTTSNFDYEPATQSRSDFSPPTADEKQKVFGFSLLVLVVGVILTPILIGIPIIIIGFWMMVFPGYWVNKAKRS